MLDITTATTNHKGIPPSNADPSVGNITRKQFNYLEPLNLKKGIPYPNRWFGMVFSTKQAHPGITQRCLVNRNVSLNDVKCLNIRQLVAHENCPAS